jgi:2'-5' RNA ligase
MRLFIAADVDGATRRQLQAAQDTLRSTLSDEPVPPRVTWVDAAVAHVTLRFVGESSPETATQLQSALTTVTLEPFEVTWGTVGVFGGRRHPKVIWVGVTSGLDAFMRLAEAIDAKIDRVIGAGRSQPFSPHLTLGRVRERGKGVDWTRALEAVRFTPTVALIEHVTLYQSRLSSKGPTYTAVSSHG